VTRFANPFLIASVVLAGSTFADNLTFEQSDDRLTLNDQGRPVFEFIHVGPPDPSQAQAVHTNYFHPLYGLLGEVLTGDSPSIWGAAPGIHWSWSRLGIGNTLVNIEEGTGAHRVIERWLGAEVYQDVAAFGVQSAWVLDSTGEAKVIENLAARVYPVEGTTRYIDITVLIRNISDDPVRLEGGLPGSGLGLTLDPERTDWGFADSTGWATKGVPYMSPWTVCTYRDERRSTRSGLAIMQDSRNPAYSSENWLVEEGPRVTVGPPESFKLDLKSAAFLEFRYRIMLFRVVGGGPDMTAEYTKFMRVDASAE
jgi:hypothetical protein